jgi:undecaprenyl pyrophosphate synthase
MLLDSDTQGDRTLDSHIDEEGLLKDIRLSELSLKISKLTFGWNNYSDPVKEAHRLMNMVRTFSLDILEYEQRMGSKLGEYQRNIIHNSMDDLEKLIPYMQNKIKPSESTVQIL